MSEVLISLREDKLFSVTVSVTSHPNRTRRIQAPAAYPGLPGRRGKRKGRGREGQGICFLAPPKY